MTPTTAEPDRVATTAGLCRGGSLLLLPLVVGDLVSCTLGMQQSCSTQYTPTILLLLQLVGALQKLLATNAAYHAWKWLTGWTVKSGGRL